jgi:L-asparaginase
MTKKVLHTILNIDDTKAIILETYGAGNAPTSNWFIDEIKNVIKKGKIVLNITQCNAGSVDMSKYETGIELSKIGVISGYDITTEAAVAKLMCLLGQYSENEDIINYIIKPLKGEISK